MDHSPSWEADSRIAGQLPEDSQQPATEQYHEPTETSPHCSHPF